MRQARLLRNIRLGIKTLLLHKLRSSLTMLGVVFGVGSVVAMLAVGEGASKEALEQIRKLGSTNIIITSIKPAEEESGGTETDATSTGRSDPAGWPEACPVEPGATAGTTLTRIGPT